MSYRWHQEEHPANIVPMHQRSRTLHIVHTDRLGKSDMPANTLLLSSEQCITRSYPSLSSKGVCDIKGHMTDEI